MLNVKLRARRAGLFNWVCCAPTAVVVESRQNLHEQPIRTTVRASWTNCASCWMIQHHPGVSGHQARKAPALGTAGAASARRVARRSSPGNEAEPVSVVGCRAVDVPPHGRRSAVRLSQGSGAPVTAGHIWHLPRSSGGCGGDCAAEALQRGHRAGVAAGGLAPPEGSPLKQGPRPRCGLRQLPGPVEIEPGRLFARGAAPAVEGQVPICDKLSRSTRIVYARRCVAKGSWSSAPQPRHLPPSSALDILPSRTHRALDGLLMGQKRPSMGIFLSIGHPIEVNAAMRTRQHSRI